MEYSDIESAFSRLSKIEQVSLLVSCYWKMTDAQKDRFLEETENA